MCVFQVQGVTVWTPVLCSGEDVQVGGEAGAVCLRAGKVEGSVKVTRFISLYQEKLRISKRGLKR